MVFWRQGLALLAGGASVLAYAPFELFPLAFLSLAVLYGLLDPMAPAGLSGMPRRRRARHGFSIGFAWGLGGWQLKCQVRSLPSVIAVLAIACGRPT